MKPTYNRYLAAMALLAFAAPSLHAATVDGTDGVNMGDNGEIGSTPTLTYPSIGFGTWLPLGANANQGLSKFIAPIGQFTGYKDDGSLVLPEDLIPLRTTSVTIVDPDTGATINVIDKNNPGKGDKGDPGPAFAEIIQIAAIESQVLTSTGQSIRFGTSQLALESPNNLYSYTVDTITLKPNHTYRLSFRTASSYANPSGGGYVVWSARFYNLTAGTYFGPASFNLANSIDNNLGSYTGDVTAYITPTVATTVVLRALDVSGGTVTLNGYSSPTYPVGTTVSVESIR